ncbi:MAG: hypothetical protein O7C75_02705 [Verrucomicrobia bacterium]|nr:hypothetical protein [Verrucomicrobiota bacterium]
MPNIIATGEVEDLIKWEEGFGTHGELFRSQTIKSPVSFTTVNEGNQIVVSFEVSDVDTFFKELESPDTAEAMENDGVKRETVKFFVLDKKMEF